MCFISRNPIQRTRFQVRVCYEKYTTCVNSLPRGHVILFNVRNTRFSGSRMLREVCVLDYVMCVSSIPREMRCQQLCNL